MCSTLSQGGDGPPAGGAVSARFSDELIGLIRAFMYAGAPQLVGTLWEIDDEATSGLMDRFYGALPEYGVAEALRKTQRAMRAKYPHPFYWAAFTAYGYQQP